MKWFILLGLAGALVMALFHLTLAGDLPVAGQAAPDFSLKDQEGKLHNLAEFKGKWLVLYFYPKDDTPGCTQEACTFRDDLHQLTALGAEVAGVSLDDTSSHEAFAKKYHLPFPLLADRQGEVTSRYGALMNMGLIKIARRYTFLINPEGRIAKVYIKVETTHHSREIIEDLKGLQYQKQ